MHFICIVIFIIICHSDVVGDYQLNGGGGNNTILFEKLITSFEKQVY